MPCPRSYQPILSSGKPLQFEDFVDLVRAQVRAGGGGGKVVDQPQSALFVSQTAYSSPRHAPEFTERSLNHELNGCATPFPPLSLQVKNVSGTKFIEGAVKGPELGK